MTDSKPSSTLAFSSGTSAPSNAAETKTAAADAWLCKAPSH